MCLKVGERGFVCACHRESVCVCVCEGVCVHTCVCVCVCVSQVAELGAGVLVSSAECLRLLTFNVFPACCSVSVCVF